MRVLAILALAMLLAGCNGDRIKQSMNGRQAQPQSTGLAHLNAKLPSAHERFVPLCCKALDLLEIQDRWFAFSDDCRKLALLG
jgi:hypothetical protein